jgi:hypothetical protein
MYKCPIKEMCMTGDRGILINLRQTRFDDYGRVLLADRQAAGAMGKMLTGADAIACRSGCGAPLSCDTALIRTEDLMQNGPDLLINNADFASIIRKRKAVGSTETIIIFTTYREIRRLL